MLETIFSFLFDRFFFYSFKVDVTYEIIIISKFDSSLSHNQWLAFRISLLPRRSSTNSPLSRTASYHASSENTE